MRCVTRETAFVGLNRRVLKDKWAHGIGVALGADGELSRRRPHLVPSLCSVRIMAIAALDKPHIHTMTIRPREFRLLGRMASVAKLGLRLHQHEVHVVGFMRIWQLVQLTPFARCSDLEKFWVSRLDWWHLVQMAAVCAGR